MQMTGKLEENEEEIIWWSMENIRRTEQACVQKSSLNGDDDLKTIELSAEEVIALGMIQGPVGKETSHALSNHHVTLPHFSLNPTPRRHLHGGGRSF